MNVLLVGGGGREHALAWKLKQSPLLDKLFCAPGNAGIANVAECLGLDITNHDAVISFCREKDIGLVVVGPEQPLVEGLVDSVEAAGITAFGPTAKAAELEGSKGFTKDLCAKKNIPTATYQRFTSATKAKAHATGQPLPLVIKADGLAAGKGVVIAETMEQATQAIDKCLDGLEGAALVMEEYLEGEEASLFFLCDGKSAMFFGTAQDHKRVGEGDTGPNTGGMGAYSPAPVMSKALIDQAVEEIIEPTLEGMREIGAPFSGVLYAGLMIDKEGPKLIEYNVRFGDPECQVLMMRLESDLLPLLLAAAEGRLGEMEAQWSSDTALTIVLASKGYPGAYKKDTVITGLEGLDNEHLTVFHAGTAINGKDLVATGGRVLNVTALGATIIEARERAYGVVEKIDWAEGFYRRDIGWRAVERCREQ